MAAFGGGDLKEPSVNTTVRLPLSGSAIRVLGLFRTALRLSGAWKSPSPFYRSASHIGCDLSNRDSVTSVHMTTCIIELGRKQTLVAIGWKFWQKKSN
jgi:hypothetical protein